MNEQKTNNQAASFLSRALSSIQNDDTREPWERRDVYLLILHIGILIYTLTHAINASLHFAGSGVVMVAGQIIGVIIVECFIMRLYLKWIAGELDNTGEQIVALVGYVSAGILVGLTSVADSRLNSGSQLSPLLFWHMTTGLPLAPLFVGLFIGALEIADPNVRARITRTTGARKSATARFKALMAEADAQREADARLAALELATKIARAEAMSTQWTTADIQRRIERQAAADIPQILYDAGITFLDAGEPVGESLRSRVAKVIGKNHTDADARNLRAALHEKTNRDLLEWLDIYDAAGQSDRDNMIDELLGYTVDVSQPPRRPTPTASSHPLDTSTGTHFTQNNNGRRHGLGGISRAHAHEARKDRGQETTHETSHPR